MSRTSYRLVALGTLPLPFLGAYAIGARLSAWLPDFGGSLSGLLTILGYLLILLGCVLVWAVALLPLRRRAGFTPLSDELQSVQQEGLGNAVAREQAALAARATSSDPSERAGYHLTFAAVSGLFSVTAVALTWALWDAGYVAALVVAALFVCPVLTVYHGVQALRARLGG